MEKELTWVEICLLIAMFGGAFTVIAFFFAYATLGIEKDKVGDFPTWFGAVGTVGTLIGTIYLATTQERRRLSEQRIKSEVLVPIVIWQLDNIGGWVSAARTALEHWNGENPEADDRWEEMIEVAGNSLSKVAFPEVSDLQELAFVDKKSALIVHDARGRFIVTQHYTANLVAYGPGERAEEIAFAIASLEQISADCTAATERLENLLRKITE